MSHMAHKKIGSILGRLLRIGDREYQLDFTCHENEYDSDDEENSMQWSHSIRFLYSSHNGTEQFLNLNEISYDTRERYTARIFWKNESTTIIKMIEDTMAVRKAKGEKIPVWSISKLCNAGYSVWWKHKTK